MAKTMQKGVPFTEEPFAEIANTVELSAEDVLAQLRVWTEDGKLREISAILEGSVLGYESALVAAKVPSKEMVRVAKLLNTHPTVTHNYERSHDFNLWFTIAMPEEIGIDAVIEALVKLTGVAEMYPLRRTVTFKIGVNFDLKSLKSDTQQIKMNETQKVEVSEEDIACFRVLQVPLPLSPRPFRELAEKAGVSEAVLLEFAKKHHGNAIRRYVATFRHRKLGVRGNGMAVWNVPEERMQEVGLALAGAAEVSHCYARECVDGFPFNVYSMIHGPDRESCLEVARRESENLNIEDYTVLFSTREFKKVRLRYFLPELDEWWSEHGSMGRVA
ncbi:MAG: Lrp/AsnC family transcriptional regulator [Deltaproteobacteria bacterium]|nr:Lrp/AsnC family transcriptional regulator [Deltaproteobacteria bacterium]